MPKINTKAQLSIYLGLCLLMLFSSCAKIEPQAITVTTPEIRKVTPTYLGEVWPLPGSLLEFHGIQEKGIGIKVTFLPEMIAEVGDFDVNWIERCSLTVDGIVISQGSVLDGVELKQGINELDEIIYQVSGPYYLTWNVALEEGEHQVVFRTSKTSGAILEYNWTFTTVN